MATIQAIEARSIHQIQSGQVIVDLTSVVKELVENSLDAGASKIDVRFKNHGVDSIEVHDDGNGVAPEDFATVALKHHTSKLLKFEDLETLETFGFRGEALSSLCALANVHITTARAQDGAVGHRLDFEKSGKLRSTTVIAAQKGTIVSVENIFHGLPVRRKELEKNAKREWLRVLTFMYSYACIGTGIRFSISNQPTKGNKSTAFSTKGNATTRENIANVFNVKTLAYLVTLKLELELQPTNSRLTKAVLGDRSRRVTVEGHVSRPAYGEGRQTPDRQMYFVNSRPCLLPQVSKVFNEVYKSFNHHQSPFVLANFIMDTNAYDVNVSPDKKSIMLRDQTALLETLKTSLTELFQNADHTMPQSQLPVQRLPVYKPLTVSRTASEHSVVSPEESTIENMHGDGVMTSKARSRASSTTSGSGSLIEDWAGRDSTMRRQKRAPKTTETDVDVSKQRRIFDGPRFAEATGRSHGDDELSLEHGSVDTVATELADHTAAATSIGADDAADPPSTAYDDVFLRTPPRSTATQRANASIKGPSSIQYNTTASGSQSRRNGLSSTQPRPQRRSQRGPGEVDDQQAILSAFNAMPKVSAGPINDAFARMRPRRISDESSEITIGGSTTHPAISSNWSHKRRRIHMSKGQLTDKESPSSSMLSQSLLNFAAPGSQLLVTTQSTHHGVHSEHSDSGSELLDADDLPSDSDLELESPDRAAFNLGLHHPSARTLHVAGVDADDPDTIEMEAEKRLREDEVIARLIQNAELPISQRNGDTSQRAIMANGNTSRRKDFIYDLSCSVHLSIEQVKQRLFSSPDYGHAEETATQREDNKDMDAETKLSLTINKADFERMTIVGQFNLGFILTVRPASGEGDKDELFIVDQHAADEKSNFERLQKTVKLQSQPLVQPKLLDLTAVEEEVVSNHAEALKANGFEIDISQDSDIDCFANRTYRLLTLPTSRETTFKLTDLEELMHLLSEISIESSEIPRPRKVQKMLAMRACRSSIMVGKTLTTSQMKKVVQHMGTMEKPWNCPHGRPTMRHLTSLGSWQSWQEGQPVDSDGISSPQVCDEKTKWKKWLQQGS